MYGMSVAVTIFPEMSALLGKKGGVNGAIRLVLGLGLGWRNGRGAPRLRHYSNLSLSRSQPLVCYGEENTSAARC